ncbi:MAG: monovalent cation/H(+) antiporter subunit G [Chloroflexota bacterium]
MIVNIIVVILLITGCFFFIVGTLGVLRLPDVFSRLHPATKCDTLGSGSVILAMAIYGGWSSDIYRLGLITFFLLISSVVCSHAIGRSAIKSGLKHGGTEPQVNPQKKMEKNDS